MALFRRGGISPTSAIIVAANTVTGVTVPFNEEAKCWLGVLLDSQLTLKDHHTVPLKEGKNAIIRLRQLAGQIGLSPANCRKVVTARIQSAGMFGSGLWWKGDQV